jgi:regulator of protease activity HflC (stomatin/prohibitin superfamily)
MNSGEQGLQHLEAALRLCFGGFRIIFWVCFAVFLLSGIHTVPQGHVGHVQRLGVWTEGQEEPGVHFAFPPFIDQVYIDDVQGQRTLHLDRFKASSEGLNDTGGLAVMTAGGQLLHHQWTLNYRLESPLLARLCFPGLNESHVNQVLKEWLSSVIVKKSASRDIDNILKNQAGYSLSIREDFEELLRSSNSGLIVDDLGMHGIAVPQPTQMAFEEVQRQLLGRDRLREEAKNEAIKLRQQARAKVSSTLGQARAKAETIAADLQADAKNLESLTKEYSPSSRQTFLRLKGLALIRQAMKENRDQTYLTLPGGELRLKISKDPTVEQNQVERAEEKKRGAIP